MAPLGRCLPMTGRFLAQLLGLALNEPRQAHYPRGHCNSVNDILTTQPAHRIRCKTRSDISDFPAGQNQRSEMNDETNLCEQRCV